MIRPHSCSTPASTVSAVLRRPISSWWAGSFITWSGRNPTSTRFLPGAPASARLNSARYFSCSSRGRDNSEWLKVDMISRPSLT